jgi:hypothetical protein
MMTLHIHINGFILNNLVCILSSLKTAINTVCFYDDLHFYAIKKF